MKTIYDRELFVVVFVFAKPFCSLNSGDASTVGKSREPFSKWGK